MRLRPVTRGGRQVEEADRVGCHLGMAHEWIHRFNDSGFTTFERAPNPKGRRPIITGPQVRELIDTGQVSVPPGH